MRRHGAMRKDAACAVGKPSRGEAALPARLRALAKWRAAARSRPPCYVPGVSRFLAWRGRLQETAGAPDLEHALPRASLAVEEPMAAVVPVSEFADGSFDFARLDATRARVPFGHVAVPDFIRPAALAARRGGFPP
jgi:hypothetical protein